MLADTHSQRRVVVAADVGTVELLFVATPQQALLQTMAAMHAKAQELTGVEIPKFYNPAAINPLKFAEQQQKRKLLWSKAGENKEQSLQKFQVHLPLLLA